MKLKYYPKPLTSIVHLLLFLFVFLLFSAREKESLRFDFINDVFPDFHLYISNFAIAYLIISGVCYLWLLMGVSFRYVLYFSLAILVVNFAYEMWIPLLNTLDMVDAYYGLAGVLIATAEVYVIKRWGLLPNPHYAS
ncbi:hypothetical protein [Albibacterium indicum]|uniref:hypothetical protein n=1 Tax=Albibacterium indicum TaxID=2292082 RepID=UPI000E467AFA|nr:hypothetical protein [Pedobacter indicus]